MVLVLQYRNQDLPQPCASRFTRVHRTLRRTGPPPIRSQLLGCAYGKDRVPPPRSDSFPSAAGSRRTCRCFLSLQRHRAGSQETKRVVMIPGGDFDPYTVNLAPRRARRSVA